MEAVCDEIGIHFQHLADTSACHRFELICDKQWLQILEKRRKIAPFPLYENLDRRAHPTGNLDHPWTKVLLQIYEKKPSIKAYPLSRINRDYCSINNFDSATPLSYSQGVFEVAQSKFRNIWEKTYDTFKNAHSFSEKKSKTFQQKLNKTAPVNVVPYDSILRDLIQIIYKCPIIHCQLDRATCEHSVITSEENIPEPHENIAPALISIETSTCFVVIFYPPCITTTLYDCITYSPAIFNKTYNKPLFVIYQILQFTKYMHQQGLVVGDLCLLDILLTDNLWIWVLPKLEVNIVVYEMKDDINNVEETAKSNSKWNAAGDVNVKLDLKLPYVLRQFSLRHYCELWCTGQLSNFQYLTILNDTSGRSPNNPYYHHIMPWVTDFTARSGQNWRDLTKSKYRLCKGDIHLDLMFSQASIHNNIVQEERQTSMLNAQVPHHVSEVLSEITYFVYMARRTPQHILREHVRPIWVPAEYPASIQRLQEWTPDECIPEFYTNPMIFKSIHEDLPDLGLPTWASCPEDFILKHREALESQYVSERLHHWIDLNFGYKLSGKAAIKSKNVCLSMVDQHKHLCQRGIVQLFVYPHPPKRLTTTWFGKSAPRIQSLVQKSARVENISRHLAKSSDNIHQCSENSDKIDKISTRSMDSSSPRMTNNYQQSKIIPDDTMKRTTFYDVNNFIELPKDYNPLTVLQSYESMYSFIAKTFPSQKFTQNLEEKVLSNDLLPDDYTVDHSFTSKQLFNDEPNTDSVMTYSAKSVPGNKPNQKSATDEMREKVKIDLKVMGCLIIELFCMARLRPLLGPNVPRNNFEERLQTCLTILRNYKQDIPKCVVQTVSLLLNLEDSNILREKGFPTVSVGHLLEPIYFNTLIPFPLHYYGCYALIRSLKSFEFTANLLDIYTHFNCDGLECSKYRYIDCVRILFQRKISECKVMSCCAHMGSLMESKTYEQFPAVEILLPHIIDLLINDHTSILAAWNLLDSVGQSLGIIQTQKLLLHPVMRLYDVETFERNATLLPNRSCPSHVETSVDGNLYFSTTSSFKSRKSVKLYHHSFLLRLIIRFGLRCFLQNFIAPLIEAVGGYKEPAIDNSSHLHSSIKRSNNIGKTNQEYTSIDSPQDKLSESPLLLQMEENAENGVFNMLSMDSDDVFRFDDDVNFDNHTNISDRTSHKSLDSYDTKYTTAEEAKEDDEGKIETTPEKKAISEIFFGSTMYNNSLEETDQFTTDSQQERDISTLVGARSPTIAIPTTMFPGLGPVNTIDCNVGSCKSVETIDVMQTVLIQDIRKLENDIDDIDDKGDNTSNEQCGDETISNEKLFDSLKASDFSEAYAESSQSNRIAEMSSESLIWLSHRLGPVLTCRFISRNLLKMLSLCYMGQANLLPVANTKEDFYNLNYFSISDARVVGDSKAARVLECLVSITALYGEHVILVQYFLHITELISSVTNKISNSLEGAIISTLQLLKHLVPCLLDTTIMEHLEDLFVNSIMGPLLKILSSDDVVMPSGYLGRSILVRKFLDAVYILCARIGTDMTCKHLYKLNVRKDLCDVFSADLARSAYLAFLSILGEDSMKNTLTNFEYIFRLCHELERPAHASNDLNYNKFGNEVDKLKTFRQTIQTDLTIRNSFGTQVVGNRIEVSTHLAEMERNSVPVEKTENTIFQKEAASIVDMIAYKFEQLPTTRHLKGNWLAYWRHEITTASKDTMLNLKQIKLQSFVGHTNSVRVILPLDNENSFLSASKDKTVKLWSLRSEGDGSKQSFCQYTYMGHKKSIHSLSFLESLRLVVSCDSGVQLWDPFIGRPLTVLDSSRHNPITVVKCFPSPSPLVLAGTAEASVKIIDARCMQYVNEWRLSMNNQTSATVRCMSIPPSGNWMAVGLSSGTITLLDTRTGIVMNSWRPTECDLLQLSAPNDNQLISSALDHSLAVWNAQDGILQYQLPPPAEPAHYLQTVALELVYATTGNRIGIYSDLSNSHSFHSVAKLRSETFRGVLTSLAVLPLNRIFLAGNESGNISLFC